MQLRIVVADEGEARFYDVSRPDVRPREVGRVENPAARLHDRDLKSDRPGRTFGTARHGAGRRGAIAHHAVGGEDGPRKHEAQLFARRIVHELEQARAKGSFERIVLMASPAFLGLLRQALPKAMQSLVVAEVAKDLLHQDDEAVQSHLPREAFNSAG